MGMVVALLSSFSSSCSLDLWFGRLRGYIKYEIMVPS